MAYFFLVFVTAGCLALVLLPVLYLGTPTAFTCNLRVWFANGGTMLPLRCVLML